MKFFQLLGCLVVVFLIQILGSLWFDAGWYQTLTKPSWNPPAWIFGPVWTVLYIMIAVVGARLLKHRKALVIFAVQLGFNAIWSWLFFGLHSPGLALVDLILLWMTLTALMVLCFRDIKVCGWLLLPYYLWTSFALCLNYTIWWLNR